MAKSYLKLVTPAAVNRTVTPRRLRNADLRTREHLTEAEVERLMAAAKGNRWRHRDATTVLMAYRHGLRAAEVVDLRWDQIDFATATLHVRRVKRGTPSTHPILGDELRALRRPQREQEPKVALCVHFRARSALQHRWLCSHGRAGRGRGQAWVQGAPAHAAARLRLHAGQQRARYKGAAGLPRPPQYPAHRAIHRISARSVQKLLARLIVASPVCV